jgi:hypothetical protein
LALQRNDNAERLLGDKREAIHSTWLDMILASYPEQTVRFLMGERDRFQNPLGHRIREATGVLLQALLDVRPPRELAETIDGLVRVGAIQGQPASQALAFVFLLKRAVRNAAGGSLKADEGAWLDEWVDAVALVAFDSYVRCREEIYEIRVREAQRRVKSLLSRLGGDDEQGDIQGTEERTPIDGPGR